jgi:hypothetical protein
MDIKNFHQTPEEIIKSATPEQRILWNYVGLLCGERFTLSQVFYQGAIGGSEFNTYRARRLYLALSVNFDPIGNPQVNPNFIEFHGVGDAIEMYPSFDTVVWNATTAAVNFKCCELYLSNYLFSRVVIQGYTSMRFIGYRITY